MTDFEIARRNEAVKSMDAKRVLICERVQKKHAELKAKKAAEFNKPKKK